MTPKTAKIHIIKLILKAPSKTKNSPIKPVVHGKEIAPKQ